MSSIGLASRHTVTRTYVPCSDCTYFTCPRTTVAKLAGIMGAKQTSALIPLCHNISIKHVGYANEAWGVRMLLHANTHHPLPSLPHQFQPVVRGLSTQFYELQRQMSGHHLRLISWFHDSERGFLSLERLKRSSLSSSRVDRLRNTVSVRFVIASSCLSVL